MVTVRILEWPDNLERISRALQPGHYQEKVGFHTESGHVKSRPRRSPIPILKGDVEIVGDEAWSELDRLWRVPPPATYSAPCHDGALHHVHFAAAPTVVREVRKGAETVRTVSIVLVDHGLAPKA